MPTIKIKGSSTAAAEPLTLAERELAVNVTDKKLYVGDGAAVQKIVGSLGNQEASAVAITGGSIAGITDLAVADGGTGASTAADARTNLGITATGADTTYAFRSNNLSDLASASTARTNLGLGSIATQASSSVSITGGSITGVTDIAIADGGTGASTAADARTNLGLGSIATQSASSVAITGGTISGITDLAVADGGTGASTAADARTNLSVPSTTGSGASGTWGIDISGNAATATSATSATTATNLAGGAANRVPYQSASGTTTFVAAPTVTNSYLKWNGTALGWDTVSGGGGGSGDVVGPASATDNQIVLFDSTTGKLIKAATTTGLLKASTGVIAAAVSGTDYAPATSGSANQLLASNGTGGFTNLTTGTGVVTALGVNTGSSGAFVVNGGELGTPLSGTVTNLTGTASININGTVGATTANTGAFTTLSASSTVSGSGFSTYLASPPAIGGTAAAAGSFTTLSASSTVSGTGFSTYLASPPAIGGTAAAAGTFTTLSATGNTTLGDAVGDTLTVNATATFNNADATIYGVRVGRGAGAVATNTAVGASALNTNTTGATNTALGYQSLQANTTASNNTAVGYQAGYSNQTSGGAVFIGYQAGYSSVGISTTINYNTAIGHQAGYALTSGYGNTLIGNGAGSAITSGYKNSIIGAYNGNQGGLDIRTANNYIVLSDGDGNPLVFTANNNTVALQGGTISSGTGIAFPATQSASSDANTLDDYEEGTWTSSLTVTASTSGTITVTDKGGTYTKIGNIVTVQGYFNVASVSSPVGELRIGGLPFTISSSYGIGSASLQPYGFGTTSTVTAYYGLQISNQTYFAIRGFNNGAQVTTVANNVQAGTGMQFTVTYQV